MKFSEKFINHTSKIEGHLANDEDFHLATEEQYNSLHNVIEEELMELKQFVNIKYSRRPDLIESFRESQQIPAIITDQKAQFLAVISEIAVTSMGETKSIYYNSDLRISKKAGIKIRMKFRKTYVDLLRQIDRECYTVVLKDNQKAINALTKNNSDLFYHAIYEYTSRSILVLPSLLLLTHKLKDLKIIKGRDLEYERSKRNSSSFSHNTSESDQYFLIQKHKKTVGSFSLARPIGRNLKVEAKSKYVRLWISFANMVFSHRYEEKLPWTYITSLYLDDEIDLSECLKMMMKYLFRKKKIVSGEILLFCHHPRELLKLELIAPIIKTNGILYRVSTDKTPPNPLTGPIYLNPLNL